MAKKRRGRYPCESCEDTFKTPQAKWGHVPHCKGRKLSQQLATQAEAEPVSTSRADHITRRPGPDSQENKLLLLEAYELIQQFQENARHCAAISYLMAERNVRGQYERAKEWLAVYNDLTDIERDCFQMVGRLRLDRGLLFRIYHQIRPIRDTWVHYQTHDLNPADKERVEAIRKEEAKWDTLMTMIKKLLVASR